MGRLTSESENECLCGKGTVRVRTTENDHPYLTGTNSWERQEVVRACAACGGSAWKTVKVLTDDEARAELDEAVRKMNER